MNKKNKFDLFLLDRVLENQRLDGLDVLKEIRKDSPDSCFIIITAHPKVESYIDALQLGIYDYLLKGSLSNDTLIQTVKKGLEWLELSQENKSLKEILYNYNNMIGSSLAMQDIFVMIRNVAKSESTTVLIRGESGTGKELVASAIHFNGGRKDKPFITVNCPILSDELLASQLFGHVKGAFTGAIYDKKGLFQEADGGTIFLDEIADIHITTQSKLLRVLEKQIFSKLGSNEPIKTDVRVIAATNQNLNDMIDKKEFRQDLYFRLNVAPIVLPPLRERKEDIPQLVKHFLKKISIKLNKNFTGMTSDALDCLVKYRWDGNVREMENSLERVMIHSDGPIIQRSDLIKAQIFDFDIPPSLISISALPELNATLGRLNLKKYLDIQDKDLQTHVFIHTLIECEGSMTLLRDSLKISKATANDHAKLALEQILISLCKTSGNIEDLADYWNINFGKLLKVLWSKSRYFNYFKKLVNKYSDVVTIAERLGVSAKDLKKSMARVQNRISF